MSIEVTATVTTSVITDFLFQISNIILIRHELIVYESFYKLNCSLKFN